MTHADERDRPWSEVVSTDFVLSAKNGQWYEVLDIWPVGTSMKWRPRGVEIKKPFTVPAAATVRVRRSEMGEAVDIVVGIFHSGPNGYRDAGTDQLDPFIQRIRGVLRRMNETSETRLPWSVAKQYVLDEMHQKAIEEQR